MGKFTPTEKQEKAFNNVIKAFQYAKKTGLVFYAKQDSIVAYKKNADNYLKQFEFQMQLMGQGDEVENLNSRECIQDSGADDYGRYQTIEDEKYYTK